MRCVICTVFERHYHLGLAVLVNSLCRWGFKGEVYAGFRGPIPPWVEGAKKQENGHLLLEVNPEVRLLLVPLETTAHLTNYKPTFMLEIEKLVGAQTDAMIYMDPDIVLDIEWKFIEDWLTCGVCVCEDVNSPLPGNHPTRVGWRRFFKPFGHELKFRGTEYANGGFLGFTWPHRQAMVLWQEFNARIADLLGGDHVAGITGGTQLPQVYGFADCFAKTDQDALNAVLEALPAEIPVSILGREAMGFQLGRIALPHALGNSKPWTRNYLKRALSGIAPMRVDKLYWANAEGPLRPFAESHIRSVRWQLKVCSAIGRVIRRNP